MFTMKTLITLLVLGTSSVALAQPSTVAPYTYDQRYAQPPLQAPAAPVPSYDQRYDDRFDGRLDSERRFDQRRFRRPVMLASNVSLMRQWNHDQRPMLIDLPARTGGITKLRIERNQGRMMLDSVVINFADGHQQTVRINQMLSARQPSVHIDLDHGAATSMYVYGSTNRGRATFDVIGLRR
jgi:hypothetical protein